MGLTERHLKVFVNHLRIGAPTASLRFQSSILPAIPPETVEKDETSNAPYPVSKTLPEGLPRASRVFYEDWGH